MRIVADSEMGTLVLSKARELVDAISFGHNLVIKESLKILDGMPKETFLGAMQIALDATEDVDSIFKSYSAGMPVEQAQWAIFATGLVANMVTTTGVAVQSLGLMDPKSGDVYDPPAMSRYIQYTALTCLGTQILAAAAYDMYGKLDREMGGAVGDISDLLEKLKARGIVAPEEVKGRGAHRPENADKPKAKVRKRPAKVTFPSKLDV